MIIEEIKHLCPDCGSDQLKRNGFTSGGKQKYNRLTITNWIKKSQKSAQPE